MAKNTLIKKPKNERRKAAELTSLATSKGAVWAELPRGIITIFLASQVPGGATRKATKTAKKNGNGAADAAFKREIGRASCRERV